ncbi:MAG: YgcG family protein [Sandaracinaceae bacterium]
MRTWALALWAAALALTPVDAAAQDPGQLVRPNGCVLDETNTLNAASIAAIQEQCDDVAAAGHELAVVVIARAGSRGPAQYALDLFNTWRLGGPDDSDGVLLFAALDDRAAEITLGDDLDTPANTARSDRIMADVIVPAFRRGSPNDALREGARYVAANLFSPGPAEFVAPRRAESPGRTASSSRTGLPLPPSVPSPAYRSQPEEPSFFDSVSAMLRGWVGWAVSAFLGLLALFGIRFGVRYRPRKCDQCGSPMQRLDEQQDDALLSSGQQKEEEIGSVDYDVWACQSCDHVDERRYTNWLSRYRACGSCGARTRSSSSRTVRAATQYSTGLAEVTVRCAHCGRSSTHTRVIPKKPPPNQNNSSGGSSGGGFSSSSGGGGGFSSGGGSSGRW